MIYVTKNESPFPGIVMVGEASLDVVAAAGILSAVVCKDFSCDTFEDGSFTITTLNLPIVSWEFEGDALELALLRTFVNKVFNLQDNGYESFLDWKWDIRRKLMETFGVPEVDFAFCFTLRLKDMISAIQLYREGTCTFREAVDIAFYVEPWIYPPSVI